METPICYLLEMMQEKQNEGSRILISDCNLKNVCVVWLRTAANERGKEVRALPTFTMNNTTLFVTPVIEYNTMKYNAKGIFSP